MRTSRVRRPGRRLGNLDRNRRSSAAPQAGDHLQDGRGRPALSGDSQRLELVAGTLESVRAELEDPSRFAAMLEARLPDVWPPPLNDVQAMEFTAARLEEDPDSVGWWLWRVILRQSDDGRRVVVGVVGGKGKPSADGTAEIGYSIVEQFQRRGYATEAVRGLLGWVFGHERVCRVIAHTLPGLAPSIGVLEKLGFDFVGEGTEEGAIMYELTREAFEQDRH